MDSFHLRFCLDRVANLTGKSGWYDNADYSIFNLFSDDPSDIPAKPGVYVFGIADGTMLVYPWGTSPVFYIGRSKNLRGRI